MVFHYGSPCYDRDIPCSQVSWLNVVYQFTQNCSTNSAQSQLKSQQAHKKESEVAQSYPTLCDPMDCSLPGSSIHGIFQARILEWVAISFLCLCVHVYMYTGFPRGSVSKESACNVGHLFSIPELGRSPGEYRLPTPVFWQGPCSHKELDTTK